MRDEKEAARQGELDGPKTDVKTTRDGADSGLNSVPAKQEKSPSQKRREAAEYVRQTHGGERDQYELAGGSHTLPPPTKDSEVEVEYLYQDQRRQPYLQVVRFKPKAFRQFHWEGHWVPGKPSGPVIPYCLPQLIEAPADQPVYVCEGEKDTDNVGNLGNVPSDMIVTCAPGGAGKWPDELNQWFKGKQKVFILQDNDAAGRKHAKKVARSLAPFVGEVRIVKFTDVDHKGDVSDWIAMGHTREDLIARCEAAPVFQKTTIDVRPGDLVDITDQTEIALLDDDFGIYQRGNELVRVIKLDRQVGKEREVRRNKGATVIVPVKDAWLVERMAQSIRWTRTTISPKTQKEKVTDIDPPSIYCRTLLSREGNWRFPVLRGVVTAPTMDRDGRIIQEPGYDEASGLLLDFGEKVFPAVPDSPTKEDAVAALKRLATPLREFPFEDEGSKAVALAALLSGLVRPNMGSMPLHAFDAPVAGTGKSMLAEMVGLLASGTKPPALAQGHSNEEDQKRLSTVLHAGDSVIMIDNCELPIQGEFLCSMLTQETVQARILGLSERRILPSTALVLATGNNLIIQGDTTRRAVICRLDAKKEKPAEREFDFDAQDELMADRPALVVAGLTALKAYALAEDKPKITPMGSFPDYDLIRGTLVWCGYEDPKVTQKALMDVDPKTTELIEIMDLWNGIFADKTASVAEIGKRGHESLLYQALMNASGSRTGMWNAKSVGWWLKRNKDRMIGGKAFRADGDRGWRLEGGGM
jgi:hypothetical protein